VAITGHKGMAERCRAAGFDACLEKPVRYADVVKAVEAAAGRGA
jgi:CheY-like chemotaxis protein